MPLPDSEPWDRDEASRGRMRYRLCLWLLVALGVVGLVCGGVPLAMHLRKAAAEQEARRQNVLLGERQSRLAAEKAREAAEMERYGRPVGWVPGVDRGSHSRSAIPRAEFEGLVLGKTPAEVWQRFPNGPMPADVNEAEKLEFIGETADPTSGAPDAAIEVFFENGKAVRVVYP